MSAGDKNPDFKFMASVLLIEPSPYPFILRFKGRNSFVLTCPFIPMRIRKTRVEDKTQTEQISPAIVLTISAGKGIGFKA